MDNSEPSSLANKKRKRASIQTGGTAVSGGQIPASDDISGANGVAGGAWMAENDPNAGGTAAAMAAAQGFANASLLALAPSLPIIRMPSSIYLDLISSTAPVLQYPSCCPSQSQYHQFILVGTREVFNEKLVVQVKCAVPFPSSEAGLLNTLASFMNSNGQTVIGWAVASRHVDINSSNNNAVTDAAAAQIASSYFDMFHAAVLNVFTRNSHALRTDHSISALSKFCIDTCTFLQDCIGLVAIPRNVYAGGAVMIAFDSPQLMPYDIERRLAVLCPPLFAAIDPKLASENGINNEPQSHLSSQSTVASIPSHLQPHAHLPTPSPHPPLPLPVPPALVNQLPHATLHIQPSIPSGFLSSCFGPDALLRGVWELEGTKVPQDFALSGTQRSGSAQQQLDIASQNPPGIPLFLAERVEGLRTQISGPLHDRVDRYEKSLNDFYDLLRVADGLGKLTAEDVFARIQY